MKINFSEQFLTFFPIYVILLFCEVNILRKKQTVRKVGTQSYGSVVDCRAAGGKQGGCISLSSVSKEKSFPALQFYLLIRDVLCGARLSLSNLSIYRVCTGFIGECKDHLNTYSQVFTYRYSYVLWQVFGCEKFLTPKLLPGKENL